jgi:hypothetical protein
MVVTVDGVLPLHIGRSVGVVRPVHEADEPPEVRCRDPHHTTGLQDAVALAQHGLGTDVRNVLDHVLGVDEVEAAGRHREGLGGVEEDDVELRRDEVGAQPPGFAVHAGADQELANLMGVEIATDGPTPAGATERVQTDGADLRQQWVGLDGLADTQHQRAFGLRRGIAVIGHGAIVADDRPRRVTRG